MSSIRSDPTTYDLKLAAPLALFYGVFFIAPLAILLYVSLHTDPSMTRMGLRRSTRSFCSTRSPSRCSAHTLWIGARGDGALLGARAAAGVDLRPCAGVGASHR